MGCRQSQHTIPAQPQLITSTINSPASSPNELPEWIEIISLPADGMQWLAKAIGPSLVITLQSITRCPFGLVIDVYMRVIGFVRPAMARAAPMIFGPMLEERIRGALNDALSRRDETQSLVLGRCFVMYDEEQNITWLYEVSSNGTDVAYSCYTGNSLHQLRELGEKLHLTNRCHPKYAIVPPMARVTNWPGATCRVTFPQLPGSFWVTLPPQTKGFDTKHPQISMSLADSASGFCGIDENIPYAFIHPSCPTGRNVEDGCEPINQENYSAGTCRDVLRAWVEATDQNIRFAQALQRESSIYSLEELNNFLHVLGGPLYPVDEIRGYQLNNPLCLWTKDQFCPAIRHCIFVHTGKAHYCQLIGLGRPQMEEYASYMTWILSMTAVPPNIERENKYLLEMTSNGDNNLIITPNQSWQISQMADMFPNSLDNGMHPQGLNGSSFSDLNPGSTDGMVFGPSGTLKSEDGSLISVLAKLKAHRTTAPEDLEGMFILNDAYFIAMRSQCGKVAVCCDCTNSNIRRGEFSRILTWTTSRANSTQKFMEGKGIQYYQSESMMIALFDFGSFPIKESIVKEFGSVNAFDKVQINHLSNRMMIIGTDSRAAIFALRYLWRGGSSLGPVTYTDGSNMIVNVLEDDKYALEYLSECRWKSTVRRDLGSHISDITLFSVFSTLAGIGFVLFAPFRTEENGQVFFLFVGSALLSYAKPFVMIATRPYRLGTIRMLGYTDQLEKLGELFVGVIFALSEFAGEFDVVYFVLLGLGCYLVLVMFITCSLSVIGLLPKDITKLGKLIGASALPITGDIIDGIRCGDGLIPNLSPIAVAYAQTCTMTEYGWHTSIPANRKIEISGGTGWLAAG